MKPQDTAPKALSCMEVPQESMEAMARQIRGLERASKQHRHRRYMTGLSAAAAVVALLAAGWSLLDTGPVPGASEKDAVLTAHLQKAPATSSADDDKKVCQLTDNREKVIDMPQPRNSGRRYVRRPVEKPLEAEAKALPAAQEPVADTETADMYMDCPVMIYDCGKLVACGSLESVPEVYEVFHEVFGTVEESQQVVSSGMETLDDIVKNINTR